jgi:formylglycine-generating enzyme required for sulfatase activity
MKRLIQHPLCWSLLFVGLVLALSIHTADGAAALDLPAVEPIKHKAYKETIPGSKVEFEMVPILGGTYLMGSPDDEKGRGKDEGPQHPVTIRPFWMGKLEVTWDEYDIWRGDKEAVIGPGKDSPGPAATGPGADAITRPTPPYADPTFGLGHDGYPAICMTHHAAMEYCRWLSKKTGKNYRLPTEAEWEWAARAGTKTAYFFGDNPKELDDHAWFADNSEEITHEVGKKKPNPWGLYDILGNVAEWCFDSYKPDAYANRPIDKPSLNPCIAPTTNRFPDVARGGSWADKAAGCRSAARKFSDKKWIKLDPQRPQSIWWLTSAEFVGFRVIRPLDDKDPLNIVRSTVTRQSK